MVEDIDGDWQRVFYHEPCDPATEATCFSHVNVSLPLPWHSTPSFSNQQPKPTMKLRLTILNLFLAFGVQSVSADILYVNNDTAYPAEYRTFNDAFAAATPGDTIMLAGSTTSYGKIVITGKPVKVVGNKGANNTGPGQPARADELTTIVHNIYVGFDSSILSQSSVTDARLAANGTILESLTCNGALFVWSDFCTVRRCRPATSSVSIHVYGSSNLVSECRLMEARLERQVNGAVRPNHVAPGTGNTFQNCLFAEIEMDFHTSGTFSHCILGGIDVETGATTAPASFNDLAGATATLRNCIIGDDSSGVVKDEFNRGSTRLYNCLIVGSSGSDMVPSLSAGLNNLVESDPSVVFTNNFYVLAPDSPAIGAGENGENLGIYDGPAPFNWGGSPALPLINRLDILSADPTTGLTFRVEAEARD